MSTHEPAAEPDGPPPAAPGSAGTNRKAVLSVVFGVCGFALIYVTPFLGLLVAIPSITTGVHARREIVASRGAQTGDTIAVIGLTIGGGAIVTVVLSIVVAGTLGQVV